MQKLLPEREFQTIFRSVIEKQWLLQPEELKQEHKVSGLYERLEQQLSQMEEAVRATGSTQNTFLQTGIAGSRQSGVHESDEPDLSLCAAAVKDVRTKCERGTLCLCEPEESARSGCGTDGILHLDMEQLGSTDVSVRMQNRSVRTNFYLEDDASYDLVEKHLEVLNKRLKSKGLPVFHHGHT